MNFGGFGDLGTPIEAHHLVGIARIKQSNAANHLVEHDTGGKDVSAVINLVASKLLWREIADFAGKLATLFNPPCGDRRNTKITELDSTVVGQKDIGRIDVSMHQGQTIAVGVG